MEEDKDKEKNDLGSDDAALWNYDSTELRKDPELEQASKPDSCESQRMPPEIPDELKVEEEWADRLGMDYDPKRVASTPPPPIYVSPDPYVPDMPQQEHRPMPPTFMVWSILSAILCCMPAGVVAIIFSAMVSSKYYARDFEGARKASRRAEIWIIASIVLGVVVNAIYLPLSLMV